MLLPTSNERLGGARFRMRIHPPIEFTPSGDHEARSLALTAAINACGRRLRARTALAMAVDSPPLADAARRDKLRQAPAQALAGAGVRVERDGSSLT